MIDNMSNSESFHTPLTFNPLLLLMIKVSLLAHFLICNISDVFTLYIWFSQLDLGFHHEILIFISHNIVFIIALHTYFTHPSSSAGA